MLVEATLPCVWPAGGLVFPKHSAETAVWKTASENERSYPISRYLSKIIENVILKRYSHTHDHCTIIHNSQDKEAT